MNTTSITTTKPTLRKLHALSQLPASVRADFDYVSQADQDTPRFCKFRGSWYDVNDTQRITTRHGAHPIGWAMVVEPEHPFASYNAIVSETYFSGLLFRFTTWEHESDAVVFVSAYSS